MNVILVFILSMFFVLVLFISRTTVRYKYLLLEALI